MVREPKPIGGSKTPRQSGPLGAFSVPPYREEPKTPPPLREALCDWCGRPLPTGHKNTCSKVCKKARKAWLAALGPRLAIWALLVRTRRPRKKGDHDPTYSQAQAELRTITDEALTRLNDARRAAAKAP